MWTRPFAGITPESFSGQWSFLPNKFKLIIAGRDDRILKSFRAAYKKMALPTRGGVSDDANKNYFRNAFGRA
jgi:hypothetical protein